MILYNAENLARLVKKYNILHNVSIAKIGFDPANIYARTSNQYAARLNMLLCGLTFDGNLN